MRRNKINILRFYWKQGCASGPLFRAKSTTTLSDWISVHS